MAPMGLIFFLSLLFFVVQNYIEYVHAFIIYTSISTPIIKETKITGTEQVPWNKMVLNGFV